MAVAFTKQMMIQRIKQHMADGFPNDDFASSDNEVLLYIDQALAYGMVGSMYNGAKVDGNLATPEAYLTTFLLPALQYDDVTKNWYSTLPQPPVSLPLGYSIDEVYFASSIYGKGTNVFFIKAKRVSYRNNMPMPFGVRTWIEGDKIWLAASDGGSLLNQNCYVRMASTRTKNITDIMHLPDDAIEQIFTNVVTKLKDRMQIPKDVIKDDLPSSNTNVRQ